jgi:hypothetical protein
MAGDTENTMKMKWKAVIFALLSSCPLAVTAGEIFGTITEGGRAVANANVEVTIANKTYKGMTDVYGGYRVVVPEVGKAKLTITVGNQAPSIEIFSSERSLRYDLVVVPGANPELRRR